ncbi:diguanylate cyclase [Pseudodesulfovibrio sp.]|uniref:sensor domain-containing diguanylate cyclase n=1 Tax=unclassified Pseudodesulfovibrio TaxID=2661612 RepID=UPI003B0093B4
MNQFSNLLKQNELWLMERILNYAKNQDYTKYTSTLLDAWRFSISGLTDALCMALHRHGDEEPQFYPDEDYTTDPITEFGRLEAKRHRERGISLSMFLGLLKYYRDTYVDFVVEQCPEEHQKKWIRFVLRSFDRFEIALCVEWVETGNYEHTDKLEEANRRLSNEKNKYLTFFESSPRPTFLVDKDGLVDNLNLAAAKLLGLSVTSGEMYYSGGHSTMDRKAEGVCKPLIEYLPWIESEASAFAQGVASTQRIETDTEALGRCFFEVFFARMLDVSGKFTGMIVVLDDITRRKQLEQKLNRLATTDALTGANNRHRFLERGEEEIARCKRYARPLAAMILDIDHFKNINDTYGHAAGDDVLRALSVECCNMFRQTDVFGRVGGEEFAAVLPETSLEEAVQVAERLRKVLGALEVNASGESITFTVSIGVVEYEEGQKLADVLYFADKALYEAKNHGRNQVVAGAPSTC